MDIIKKIVHVAAFISYVLIIVYAIVCVPMLFRYKPVVVLSGSMEPTYKVNSIIYYKKVSKNKLNVGDVITFSLNNNELVSNRIVRIDNDLIETKGDANKSSDVNKISFVNVKGKVAKYSVPYLGYYVRVINNNLSIIIMFCVIINVLEFLFSNIDSFSKIENGNGSDGCE